MHLFISKKSLSLLHAYPVQSSPGTQYVLIIPSSVCPCAVSHVQGQSRVFPQLLLLGGDARCLLSPILLFNLFPQRNQSNILV